MCEMKMATCSQYLNTCLLWRGGGLCMWAACHWAWCVGMLAIVAGVRVHFETGGPGQSAAPATKSSHKVTRKQCPHPALFPVSHAHDAPRRHGRPLDALQRQQHQHHFNQTPRASTQPARGPRRHHHSPWARQPPPHQSALSPPQTPPPPSAPRHTTQS